MQEQAIQIINIDYFVKKSSDATSTLPLPIIRIFGNTLSSSQKVLVNIHGVLPYVIIKRNAHNDLPGLLKANNLGQYIAKILTIRGTDFYGYNANETTWLKLYVINPHLTPKIIKCLEENIIKVYENFGYIQQFMIDYSLAGMDTLDFSTSKFRFPIPLQERVKGDYCLANLYESFLNEEEEGVDNPNPNALQWLKARFSGWKRSCHCEVEVDIWAGDILNPRRVTEADSGRLEKQGQGGGRIFAIPTLGNLWKQEDERRRRLNLAPYKVVHDDFAARDINIDADIFWGKNGKILKDRFLDAVQISAVKTAGEKVVPTSLDPTIPTFFQSIFLYPLAYQPPVCFGDQETRLYELLSKLVIPSSGEKNNHLSSAYQSLEGLDAMDEEHAWSEIELISSQLNEDDEDDLNDILAEMGEEDDLETEDINEDLKDDEDNISELEDDQENPSQAAQYIYTGSDAGEEDFEELHHFKPPELSSSIPVLTSDINDLFEPSSSPILSGGSAQISNEAFLPFEQEFNSGILDDGLDSQLARAMEEIEHTSTSPNISSRSHTHHSQRNIPQLDGCYEEEDDDAGRPLLSKGEASRLKKRKILEEELQDPQDRELRSFSSNAGSKSSDFINVTTPPPISFSKLKPFNPPIPESPSVLIDIENHASSGSTFSLPPCGQTSMLVTPTKKQSAQDIIIPNSEKSNASTDNLFALPSESNFKMTPGANPSSFSIVSPPPLALFNNPPAFTMMPSSPIQYQEPYFSNERDLPRKPMSYAGKTFPLEHRGKESENSLLRDASLNQSFPTELKGRMASDKLFTLSKLPPSLENVLHSLPPNLKTSPIIPPPPLGKEKVSQLENPTMKNKHNFKFSQSQPAGNSVGEGEILNFYSIMSVEIHVDADESGKLPDPQKNDVKAFFYAIQCDDQVRFKRSFTSDYQVGVIAVRDSFSMEMSGMLGGYKVRLVQNERCLFQDIIGLVRYFDPDILCGWEIHGSSWGFLIERAEAAYQLDFLSSLSRMLPTFTKSHYSKEEDEWGYQKQSSINTAGRLFLNCWRLMRKELTLTSYTLENVVFHVLHHRIPKFSYLKLKEWYSKGMLTRWRTLRYYFDRVQHNLDLLNRTEWINQTSEFARIYGIPLFSVVIRGSQYKVESVMARITRPTSLIIYSPSREAVRRMNAPECIALNMEPESKLFTSPMLVLDFQSLYPSIMISHNYCYSTVLGRISNIGSPNTLGAMRDFEVPPDVLESIKDHVNISPNGVVFVKSYIREGVLGRMLKELMETRIMVKQSMKLYKHNKALTRVLHAKQLGLKLLANTTFGYTAASFSGRSPCVEISDSIIQTGRATLEKGIELIHSRSEEWCGKVVYADTDSCFVILPGLSKERAFVVGNEMVHAVTDVNPAPVKLQFEKVYFPCILQAKKRYVGFKFESPEDTEPVFDAKGIETVRRDGCPAVAKCLETCIKILFRTGDLSAVKAYLYRQWTKILTDQASIQDFVIAKEVSLDHYRGKILPAHAHLAVQLMKEDPRTQPEHGERLPFVYVYSRSDGRLMDDAIPVEALVNTPSLRLNGLYYITKQIIPALARVFNLVGAPISQWYEEMPKTVRLIDYTASQDAAGIKEKGGGVLEQRAKKTIENYFKSVHCFVCLEISPSKICGKCKENVPSTMASLGYKLREAQVKFKIVQDICRSCTSHSNDVEVSCISSDCPVFYSKAKVTQNLKLAVKYEVAMESLERES